MNRRRGAHFRGVTRPSHRRGMGVDAHFTAVIVMPMFKIRRRFIDGRLWFFIKKKRCTVLMTSHITWRHQYNATVYLKIKICMEWVSEVEALHFNTLHHHYSTALYSLHCNVLTTLHCNHYTALYSLHCMYSLHCTALHSLHCIVITALHWTHYTALTTVHCTHYTALNSLHCTVITTLHGTHCTALYSLQ